MPNMLRQTLARVLTSTVAQQQLFDSNTTGAIDLVPGTYTFECYMALTAMDAAGASNLLFDVVGAGTATCTKFLWQIIGADVAGITGQATALTAMSATSGSAVNIVTGATQAALQVSVRGTFEVTVAGTIIPSVTLGVAAAANVIAGTYFEYDRLGPAAQGAFVGSGYRVTNSDVTVGLTRTITYSDGTVRVDKL